MKGYRFAFTFFFAFLGLTLFIGMWGCIEKKIDINMLKTDDERALYDLMVAKCDAINAKDMNRFRQIYVTDSPELKWIENVGIPMWRQNGVEFKVASLKKISIVGNDAAASFSLHGSTSRGHTWVGRVEALYVKQGNQWKIESTGQ